MCRACIQLAKYYPDETPLSEINFSVFCHSLSPCCIMSAICLVRIWLSYIYMSVETGANRCNTLLLSKLVPLHQAQSNAATPWTISTHARLLPSMRTWPQNCTRLQEFVTDRFYRTILQVFFFFNVCQLQFTALSNLIWSFLMNLWLVHGVPCGSIVCSWDSPALLWPRLQDKL